MSPPVKPRVCPDCGHDVNRHWDAGSAGPPFPVPCYAAGGGCGCTAAIDDNQGRTVDAHP